MGVWGSGGCMGAGSPAAYMKAGGSAAYSRHVGEEVQLLTVGICMGQELGPAVYSGHMGTGDYSVGTWRAECGYMGAGGSQGVQLLAVGT